MSAETEMEQVESGGSAEDQSEDSLTQPKSESGPEFLSLSRCTHCYNLRWGDDGESSSSAEDSGSEVDWETEAESRSSCSDLAFSEIRNINAESGGKDGDGGEMSEIQEAKNKKMTQRAPLINSSSLPNSPGPHLTPLSLPPHPHTVVSTLHLQVLSQKQDNNDDAFYIVKQQLSGREEEEEVEKAGRSKGRGQEGINSVERPQPFQWQQTGLLWQQWSQLTSQQHQLSYQQQPQCFSPPIAQCQRSPPPLHTLPVPCPSMLHTPQQAPNAPCANLHAPGPQPCWYCYRTYFPYPPETLCPAMRTSHYGFTGPYTPFFLS
uniref:uncharacterized protein LOC117268487 n=1 Tax=Epinephelus lanceolatus TaxID=310571 RepID=UPI001445C99D|nr:uncharacterized protein LOC117268487 [Epinephelus lanceolatus]